MDVLPKRRINVAHNTTWSLSGFDKLRIKCKAFDLEPLIDERHLLVCPGDQQQREAQPAAEVLGQRLQRAMVLEDLDAVSIFGVCVSLPLIST